MPVSEKQEQSALVTGAARRVGRAIAIALAGRGFHIGLHYHTSRQEAEQLRSEITSTGRQCTLIKADLFDLPEAIAAVRQAAGELPGLSLLVHNASIFNRGDLLETDPELYERNFAIHVRAPFFMTSEFARLRGQGHVINIVDTTVTSNDPRYFAYLLSKKTLLSFTQMAARTLAPGIRVNAIAPGSTTEPIDNPDETYMEKRARQVPLKMKGDPQFIVQGINYLIDNPFVTGECLFIDGGVHIDR